MPVCSSAGGSGDEEHGCDLSESGKENPDRKKNENKLNDLQRNNVFTEKYLYQAYYCPWHFMDNLNSKHKQIRYMKIKKL